MICVFVMLGVYFLAAGVYFKVPSAVDATENLEIVGAVVSWPLVLGYGVGFWFLAASAFRMSARGSFFGTLSADEEASGIEGRICTIF